MAGARRREAATAGGRRGQPSPAETSLGGSRPQLESVRLRAFPEAAGQHRVSCLLTPFPRAGECVARCQAAALSRAAQRPANPGSTLSLRACSKGGGREEGHAGPSDAAA